MSGAGHRPVVRVLGHQAQKWAHITMNKTMRAVRPKTDNIRQVGSAITLITYPGLDI